MRGVLDEGKPRKQRIDVGVASFRVMHMAPPACAARAHFGLIRLSLRHAADRRESAHRVAALQLGARRVIGDPIARTDALHRVVPAMREHAEGARDAALDMRLGGDADPIAGFLLHEIAWP